MWYGWASSSNLFEHSIKQSSNQIQHFGERCWRLTLECYFKVFFCWHEIFVFPSSSHIYTNQPVKLLSFLINRQWCLLWNLLCQQTFEGFLYTVHFSCLLLFAKSSALFLLFLAKVYTLLSFFAFYNASNESFAPEREPFLFVFSPLLPICYLSFFLYFDLNFNLNLFIFAWPWSRIVAKSRMIRGESPISSLHDTCLLCW